MGVRGGATKNTFYLCIIYLSYSISVLNAKAPYKSTKTEPKARRNGTPPREKGKCGLPYCVFYFLIFWVHFLLLGEEELFIQTYSNEINGDVPIAEAEVANTINHNQPTAQSVTVSP